MTEIDSRAARFTGRRRFLRQTLFGSAALFIAPLIPAKILRPQAGRKTIPKLLFFTPEEYTVMSAAASRLTGFPPPDGEPGKTIDAALRADKFLSTEDPEIQDQFHLLLTVFNSPLAALFFSFEFSRFTSMDERAQDGYLQGWMTSSLAFRRTGFQALKRLSMSMVYTDPRSFEEIGFHGIEAPGAAR